MTHMAELSKMQEAVRVSIATGLAVGCPVRDARRWRFYNNQRGYLLRALIDFPSPYPGSTTRYFAQQVVLPSFRSSPSNLTSQQRTFYEAANGKDNACLKESLSVSHE
jgi:hypothetical protein